MAARRKILVGMSGGVDSSASAALLVEQGHQVEGVFLKVWSEVETSLNGLINCPWEQDLSDAQAVADQLGIPLHVLNVQRKYFERVVARMKEGYARGETPNPDVLCNSEIKFGLLYEWATERGYDAVATGHYAQVVNRESGIGNRAELNTAADSFKDQTYFLWRVPKERFEHILFPIGHLLKSEVRGLASKFQLPNSSKPDSQGICFLGHLNVRSWLKNELGTQPGPVLTPTGERVGTHDGVGLYTIGQRQGLGIFGGGPVYYVVEKQMATNTLIVDERPAAASTSLTFALANWLVDDPQAAIVAGGLEARIRHQGDRIPVLNIVDRRSYIKEASSDQNDLPSTIYDLRLAAPAFGIATGQSVVLYQGHRVVGGGIIQ